MWNRTLRIQPLFPGKTTNVFIDTPVANNRLYYILTIMQYLLRIVNPATTFALRLSSLINEFPQVDIAAMGFPADWESKSIWSNPNL